MMSLRLKYHKKNEEKKNMTLKSCPVILHESDPKINKAVE